MNSRIILFLSAAMITACSTAKMAVDPGLEVNSEKYQITERAKIFSGGNVVFGPYKATNISRGFIKSSGSYISIDKVKFGKEKEGQDYTYQFKGKRNWNGGCKVRKGETKLGRISAGHYADLECTFVPVVSGSVRAPKWYFRMRGGMSGATTGSIKIGSKKIKVASINKVEGSSLKLGQHTGYYFYLGSTIVAGVDTINKAGPVWLNKKLSQDEKDTIGMVVVALLLNQVN